MNDNWFINIFNELNAENNMKNEHFKKVMKQAVAQLCQAQFKLGLAKLAVNRNKLKAYLLQV